MKIQKTIDEWGKRFRFTDNALSLAHDMVQQRGVQFVNTVFEKMEAEVPNPNETRIRQFNRLAGETKKEYQLNSQRRKFEAQSEANQALSKQAHVSGYRPTAKKLREQLEAMYENGEISIQEYDFGMKGLFTVFGLVDAAQAEPEPELADVPF